MLRLLLIWKLEDVSFGKLCMVGVWKIPFSPEIIFSLKSMLFTAFLTVFYQTYPPINWKFDFVKFFRILELDFVKMNYWYISGKFRNCENWCCKNEENALTELWVHFQEIDYRFVNVKVYTLKLVLICL